MALTYNGTTIEKVIYNGVELDKVIYNGVVVWESGDEFIVRGTKSSVGQLIIEAITQTTVDFGTDHFVITAGTTETITLTDENENDLIIKGNFVVKSFGQNTNGTGTPCLTITEIKKWFKNENILPNLMFCNMNLLFDIELPQNITTLGTNNILVPPYTFAFSGAKPNSNYDFTFYSLDDGTFETFGAKDTFFKNATHDNDFWYINNYILATYGSSAANRTDTFTIPNNVVGVPCFLLDNYKLTGLVFQSPCQIKTLPFNFCPVTTLTTLEIPASVEVIKTNAFGKSGTNSGLNEITFLAPRTKEITINGFATKSAKTINIYTDNNISVLNADWGNFTPTFYKLDRTTQISKLATPTITRNNNIFSVNSISGANSYHVTFSRGTSNLFVDEPNIEVDFNSAPTNINIYDYVGQPYGDKTTYYRIIVYAQNTNGDYAKSSNVTETWSIAV